MVFIYIQIDFFKNQKKLSQRMLVSRQSYDDHLVILVVFYRNVTVENTRSYN